MKSAGIRRTTLAAVTTATLIALASACGSDGGDADLSEEGARGRRIANANGCAACHGTDGQGGTGPSYIDLAGAPRELVDGSTVIADDDYLRRAIKEPEVEIVAGYNLQMPRNSLSDEQVEDVVAYIKDLSPQAGADGGQSGG